MKYIFLLLTLAIIIILIFFEKNINYHYIFDLVTRNKSTTGSPSSQILSKTKSDMIIAHAGGEIDGIKYTNSLEAVNQSIKLGANFIELDLRTTSDGVIVAVHDWNEFKSMTGNQLADVPLNLQDFKCSKYSYKYSTLTINDVIKLLENNQVYLVTDKIDNLVLLKETLGINNLSKVVVEVFTIEKYNEAISLGFDSIALNVNLKKIFIDNWLSLNKIKAITYSGDLVEESTIARRNAEKIDQMGIFSLVYYSKDPKSFLPLENIKVYVDDVMSSKDLKKMGI